jgi:hypothetical protein
MKTNIKAAPIIREHGIDPKRGRKFLRSLGINSPYQNPEAIHEAMRTLDAWRSFDVRKLRVFRRMH